MCLRACVWCTIQTVLVPGCPRFVKLVYLCVFVLSLAISFVRQSSDVGVISCVVADVSAVSRTDQGECRLPLPVSEVLQAPRVNSLHRNVEHSMPIIELTNQLAAYTRYWLCCLFCSCVSYLTPSHVHFSVHKGHHQYCTVIWYASLLSGA